MRDAARRFCGPAKWLAVILLGVALMGTKCEENIKNNIQAGGYDYLKSGASSVLNNLFPVKNLFATGT